MLPLQKIRVWCVTTIVYMIGMPTKMDSARYQHLKDMASQQGTVIAIWQQKNIKLDVTVGHNAGVADQLVSIKIFVKLVKSHFPSLRF